MISPQEAMELERDCLKVERTNTVAFGGKPALKFLYHDADCIPIIYAYDTVEARDQAFIEWAEKFFAKLQQTHSKPKGWY